MSYNAKNLAYEANEPAFLQRLRGQYGSSSGGLERPISRRPRKPKTDDDDDQPTYVDEESNEVISKEEYEALVNGGYDKQAESPEISTKAGQQSTTQSPRGDDKTAREKEGSGSKQNLAGIGGQKKRKQAKVVGDEKPAEDEDARSLDSGPRKQKQKKKKIKLSFEDE